MRAAMLFVLLLNLFSASAVVAQNVPPAPTAQQAATTTKTLTLAEAERLALKNNPNISVARLNAMISRQNIREQRSALLPTAFLSVTAVDSRPGSRVAAGALNNPVIYPRAATGATVSQLITDFGRTNNLVASSEFEAKAQDQTAIATTADILLAVDQAYFNTLETKALVSVAQQTVDARQTLVDKIQALTSAKLRSDLDLSFTQVDASRARLLLLEAQNNYQAALAGLSALLGFSDEQDFQLVEEPTAANPPPLDVLPLISEALAQRPEVLALRDRVQAAETFGHAEHDLWRPNVSALGVVGLAPVRDNHIPNWYGAVGVNINIPFSTASFLMRAHKAPIYRLPRTAKDSWICKTISRATCGTPGTIPSALSNG